MGSLFSMEANAVEEFMCPNEGISGGVIEGNLIVQGGSTCGIGIDTTVTGDVKVNPGGTLNVFYASIGGNIVAKEATVNVLEGVDLGNGPSKIAGDIILERGSNFACSTSNLDLDGGLNVRGGEPILQITDGTLNSINIMDTTEGSFDMNGAAVENSLVVGNSVFSAFAVSSTTVGGNLQLEGNTFGTLTVGADRSTGNQVSGGIRIVGNTIGTSADVKGNTAGSTIEVKNNIGAPTAAPSLACTDNKYGCTDPSDGGTCATNDVDANNNTLALGSDQCAA